jgi:formylglycine-generating enzyme required for sulfatase activity
MTRLLVALAVLGALISLTGCSETGKPQKTDQTPPEVRLFYPPADMQVSDSVQVYVAAHDVNADQADTPVDRISLLFSRPGTTRRDTIAVISTPIATSDIPDSLRESIQLPAGWQLYRSWWRTGPWPVPPRQYGAPINSGTFVLLFAVARDAAGNLGQSDFSRHRILNKGDDIHPPHAEFTITPSTGTTATTFTFDPTGTSDEIDPAHRIEIRWDFNGDGAWDINWLDRAHAVHADEPQTWVFSNARSYTARMEARNNYLPELTSPASRIVIVANRVGPAAPPEQDNFAEIPAGTYVMGDTTYLMEGSPFNTDAAEAPIHRVKFTQSYHIEKTEVTNALYLGYLRDALARAKAQYKSTQQAIYDSVGTVLYLRLADSKIYFNLDTGQFQVVSGYEEHPVTGVSWFGAEAYAALYNCRLPSEAEWEVAARGTRAEYDYPFGTWTSRRDLGKLANYRNSGDPFELGTTPRRFYDGQSHSGFLTQDGSSPFGLYDMAGNVAEWTNDWLGTYPSTPDTSAVADPQGPVLGEYKVVRGGSYLNSRTGVRCTVRVGERPQDESFSSIGFRTAYTQY